MKTSTRNEIYTYARGHMNAKYATAYAFTLQDGNLFSGEYMYSNEHITHSRFAGYCVLGTRAIKMLKPGDCVRVSDRVQPRNP